MSTLSKKLQLQVKEYRDTIDAIRELLNDQQLKVLEDALSRLESLNINIAVFGEVNSGKSALLNSLFGCNNGNPKECLFKSGPKPNTWSEAAELTNGKVWSSPGDIIITLYDTPGIAGDIEGHLDIAMKIVEKADMILYIIFEPVKGTIQVPLMKKILGSNKPVIAVINKIDVRRPSEISAIREDLMVKFKLNSEQIVECAGYPMEGSPIIDNLIDKMMVSINKHEGDLIDATVKAQLNVSVSEAKQVLFQRAEREQVLLEEKKKEVQIRYEKERDERMVMNRFIIHGSALGAGGSAGLLAIVPGADEAALTAITALMTGALCANYNKLSRSLVFTYMTLLSGALLGKMAASYLYRWIPFVGSIINAGVTFMLHEGQGWLIVSFLEKGLYSEAEIKQIGVNKLKQDAESMKNDAASLVRSMDPAKLKELKNRVSVLEAMAKNASK